MGIATTPGILGNLVQSTTRGPSPNLWNWNGSPQSMPTFLGDPNTGLFFWDDFLSAGITPATGSAANFNGGTNWYAFATTGGVLADGGVVGGSVNFSGATTAHQGVQMGSLTFPYQIVTSGGALQGRMMFECSVSLSTASLAASTADMFVGLSDTLPTAIIPITATGGTLATTPGFIGFHKRGGTTNPGDWNFVFNVAGGTPQYPTGMQALVNTVTGAVPVGATFYKLGFVFNPNAEQVFVTTAATSNQTVGQLARPMLTVYVNGLQCATFLINSDITGATFPSTIMGKSAAFLQQSTTASVSGNLDWMAIGQVAIA